MNALAEVSAKSPERFYVIEKMTAARNAIQRGCGDLVSNREKVSKFRESNLQRAQDAYLELQKAQKRVLTALDDAQLAFRETEQDALADYAGKLSQGLSRFNLMSRNYQCQSRVEVKRGCKTTQNSGECNHVEITTHHAILRRMRPL